MRGLDRKSLDIIDPYNFFSDMSEETFLEWLYEDEYGLEQMYPSYVEGLVDALVENEFYELAAIARDEYRENGYI